MEGKSSFQRIVMLILLLPVFVHAQDLPVKEGKVFYEVIDSLPGTSKDAIYVRSKQWVAEAFKKAKEVIQADDKETGELIGKGSFDCDFQYALGNVPCITKFTVRISSREGKYRAQFYDFTTESGTAGSKMNMEYWNEHPGKNPNKKIIAEVSKTMESLIADLKKKMSKKDDF